MPRHEIIDAASRAMLAKSESCAALGIRKLERNPWHQDKPTKVKGIHFHNFTWPLGHFPYPICSKRHARPARRPTTILMVADYKYTQLIPSWAEQVHALGLQCAVGDVGDVATGTNVTHMRNSSEPRALTACEAAAAAGCECFTPPVGGRAKKKVANRWALDGVMALAVRWRFLYAKQLMERGQAVLMHDADVIFRPRGLAIFKAWASRPPSIDFAVQDNGRRRETYDDLNWGFTWMSGSRTSISLIGCLLDVWMHGAFNPPMYGQRASKAYYARSQPRVNHIVESAIEFARSPSAAPRVCTFPTEFLDRTMVHFSGYINPNHKIFCARARGVLDDTTQALRHQLVYRVPYNATIQQQTRALATALNLAKSLQMGVSIPYAAFNNKIVPFCHLYDVMRLPKRRLLTYSVAYGNKPIIRGACANGEVEASPAALHRVLQNLPRDQTTPSSKTWHCLNFDSLLRLADADKAMLSGVARVKTCNPNIACVHSAHGCHEGIFRQNVPHASACPKIMKSPGPI